MAIYFVETGLLLIVGPWTVWWRRNFFAEALPWLQMIMASPATRAVVMATGVITMAAGVSEIRQLIDRRLARRREALQSPPPPP